MRYWMNITHNLIGTSLVTEIKWDYISRVLIANQLERIAGMRKLGIIFMIGLATLFGGEKLQVGDKAPEFKLLGDDGKIHQLSDYRGELVVVYFYPKDETPGCTREACSFRDNYAEFKKLGIPVLGISYDDRESHIAFKKKYDLPFTLLSDTDKSASEAYGTKGLFMASRETFIIGKDGKIEKIYPKVSVSEHAETILADLAALK